MQTISQKTCQLHNILVIKKKFACVELDSAYFVNSHNKEILWGFLISTFY